MKLFQKISQNFLNLLYPSPNSCPLCRQNLKSSDLICEKCSKELKKWQISRAGYKLYPAGKLINGNRYSYRALYAAAPYRGVFREAIHRLKYGKQTFLAPVLGKLMARHLEECTRKSFDLIVPVPLAPGKGAQRGFNQAGLLAEIVGLKLNIPVDKKLLYKKKETPTQAHLKRDKRLENLKGVFAVSRKLNQKPHVLLIDDIITTGATVQEASLTLCQEGAGQVEVLVWARNLGD